MIGGFIGNPIGGVINVSNIFLSVTTGSYTITGQAAAFIGKLTAVAGSYTVTGQTVLFVDKMVASAGSYAITGQTVLFNETVAPVAGSYSITGQAALFATRELVTSGSYAITGQTGLFATAEKVTAGAYAISGVAIAFAVNFVCAPGAYALTGTPVTFSQVINGSGGWEKYYKGKLQLERRKIRITDDEGRARKVDMLRHLKPPAPFAPAPEWVLGKASPPKPGISSGDDERIFAPAPVLSAPQLPQSLHSLQHMRDENDLVEFLKSAPDPHADHIRHVLGALAASGHLQAMLENA